MPVYGNRREWYVDEARKQKARADALQAERDALREALELYATIDPDDEPWTVPLWQPARVALAATTSPED